MRSRSQRPRHAPVIALACLAGLGLSGCQVGRTFFQMSSDAPAPFFGMDLLPKRDRRSPTEGVSRFQSEVETDQVQTASRSEPAQEPEPPARRWGGLLGRTARSEPLTLPATRETDARDIDEAPVEQFR